MALPDRYAGDDFYCDVAIPHAGQLAVVHDDELVLAYHHTRPFWATHLVVVPKRHIDSFTAVTERDEVDVRRLFAVVQRLALEVTESEEPAPLPPPLHSHP